MAVPHQELFRDARQLLRHQLLLTLQALILASAPAGYWLTQLLAKPLRALAEDTRSVSIFDFSAKPTYAIRGSQKWICWPPQRCR